jgi:hypothetical protein
LGDGGRRDAWPTPTARRLRTLPPCSRIIAAGVNPKALSTFIGHANISITLDRYGHLMPGSEAEAAGLLDGYLEAERVRAEVQARGATGEQTAEQLANKAPAAH